jgi:electron transport complex protein RnfB
MQVAIALNMNTADDIDGLLPQTQCTRCGYTGCRPYAEAIASGLAQINQCPPGGAATIAALARLLHREPLPLNPANGIEGPALVAVIDEDRCIGCVKCLPPCPVDAIVGARKHMHTVLADVCTGCELCIAPCPVDCISMVPRLTNARGEATGATSAEVIEVTGREVSEPTRGEVIGVTGVAPIAQMPGNPSPLLNRERFYAHNARIAQRAAAQADLLAVRKQAARIQPPAPVNPQ